MGKTWVLDTETKGTGANVVPLEKALERSEPDDRQVRRSKPRKPAGGAERPRKRSSAAVKPTSATALPPGHVRKQSTGEIGRVEAVDAKAGTATVYWLKRGAASTVPLSAISRR